ncbi:hypothetical protein B0H17DRAFT_1200292 [Mycena rosella]|uniref:DUF6535 domain-containing protein n=1 Tax=Mycena rosella TaxID=1033263 RepID=A0AAD7GIN4_MYCRO|nr:hypothetical protein B0H17DRAFT_1200292 [Mycena rosella]
MVPELSAAISELKRPSTSNSRRSHASSNSKSSVSPASGGDPPQDATEVNEDMQKIPQNANQSSTLSNYVPHSVPQGVQAVPNSGDEGIGLGILFRLSSPTDYRLKYAEDPPYKELDPEPRVWHSGDSLDILLVFAGLFSGVLTTFVAQTS